MITVQDVYDFIDSIAPFSTQLDFDNACLQLGDPSAEVRGIHTALDVTDRVIDEAVAAGANLIVTHHPLIFSGLKQLVETDYVARLVCRLIRSNIALISAHTNLDQAPGGMNDALAAACGLSDVTGEGLVRVGKLPHQMTAAALADHLTCALHTTVRLMGSPDVTVSRLGLCSGGGSDEWHEAEALGCEAFLSGEVKHHHALEMVGSGIAALEAGHFATEMPGVIVLAKALQNHLNAVQCNVRVSTSQAEAYAFPAGLDGKA